MLCKEILMYKFKTIQALRALACIYVFPGHLIFYFQHLFPNTILKSVFYFGFSGINMFFEISGFVIYVSTKNVERKLVSFLNYFKKGYSYFPFVLDFVYSFSFGKLFFKHIAIKKYSWFFFLTPISFSCFWYFPDT